jgi:signal transduction histidine kinase
MLRITLEDHLLAIRIEDNGRGFDLEYAEGGNGLENLKQRMRVAGGDCRIESRRGQGTTVLLTLPLLGADKPVS